MSFELSREYIKKRNQVLSPKERQIISSLLWKEIASQSIKPERNREYIKYLENITRKLK